MTRYLDAAIADLLHLPARERPPAVLEYRSRFHTWHRRASVRQPARASVEKLPPLGGKVVYFPPELFPVTGHELVQARGADAVGQVLAQRLYQYLNFTTDLELLAVLPVAAAISRGRVGFDLPTAMRRDAFKIVTDESWHAQFSYEVMEDIWAATNVAPCLTSAPQFARRLDHLADCIDPQLRGSEQLLFAIVSETLISSILVELPTDPRLPERVREVVADHARDEGRHHAYFRRFLDYFWHYLSPHERRCVGVLVPAAIRAFLEPDYQAFGVALSSIGISGGDAARVLEETYPSEVLARSMADAARPTVRYFEEVGALDDPATQDAFKSAGLVT